MRIRFGLALTLLGIWSCDQEPTIIVGRIAIPDSGHAVYDCSSEKVLGPGGYSWCPYSEATGKSEWLESAPQSEQGVSFVAHSPQDVRAGIAFQFSPNGEFRDLSTYEKMVLNVDMTQGDSFEVFLGQGPGLGCSYVFPNKSSSGTYEVTLRDAAWCVPSQCGFNLKSSGGLVLARVPVSSDLTATVKSINFASTGNAAGSARALGAGTGPGQLCWFLIGWNNGNAWWEGGPVTSNSAFVGAKSSGDAVAGMAFEVPQGLVLSEYRSIQIVADVQVLNNQSSTFLIQGVNEDRGLIWTRTRQNGPATYVIPLSQSDSSFPNGNSSLSLDQIKRFEIISPVGGSSELKINVTDVQFLR